MSLADCIPWKGLKSPGSCRSLMLSWNNSPDRLIFATCPSICRSTPTAALSVSRRTLKVRAPFVAALTSVRYGTILSVIASLLGQPGPLFGLALRLGPAPFPRSPAAPFQFFRHDILLLPLASYLPPAVPTGITPQQQTRARLDGRSRLGIVISCVCVRRQRYRDCQAPDFSAQRYRESLSRLPPARKHAMPSPQHLPGD